MKKTLDKPSFAYYLCIVESTVVITLVARD